MGVAFSSTSEYTKEAANSISDLNPNAADILISTVITSLVTDLGVVSPTASGLLSIFDGKQNKVSTVDGYFVSPKEYNGFDHEQHVASLTYGGYVETGIKANTIAVPGVYKILEYVHKKFGSIPLENLFEYPINLARSGFTLSDVTLEYFEHSLDPVYSWDTTSKDKLSILSIGDPKKAIVKMEKLADTYQYMAEEGLDEFYFGDIGKEICKTIADGGGHITMNDLNEYDLIHDSMFHAKYKTLELNGHSGPSIGGLMVLKYLEALDNNSNNLVKDLHDVYMDRKNHYEVFNNRQKMITDEILKAKSSPSTIQFSVSDTDNNHFALTVSSGYGCGLLCPRTGMYFNNSLGEIELNPQGFLGNTNNERLISNMSPMIIVTNNSVYTIGSPGADRISSSIATVINKYTETDDWVSSIDFPRFHVNQDETIRSEPDAIGDSEGTTFTKPYDMYFGGVCMTGLNSDNTLFSKGDKRRGDISWIG